MAVPQGWVIQSDEQKERMQKMGKDLIAGNDENLKAVLDAKEVRSADLFVASEHKIGAPVDFNPNISLSAENMSGMPGISSGKDYLFHAKKILQQSQVKYSKISEEFEAVEINGKTFHRMDMELILMKTTIKQSFYSAIINGFSFSIIISYKTTEQQELLMKSVNSLTFKAQEK
jgi:hypothetical protein